MLNLQLLVQLLSTLYSGEELIKNTTYLTKIISHNLTIIWQKLMANTSNSSYSRIVLFAMISVNFSYLLLLGFRIARQFNRQPRVSDKP